MSKKKANFFRTKEEDLMSGLFAYYPLLSNSNDAISGYDGVDTNIFHNVDGANFNGVSSEINIADNDAFSFTDGVNDKPFTITFKTKLDAIQNSAFVSKISNVSSPREYALEYNNNSSKLRFRLFSFSALNRLDLDHIITPNTNQEYYIAATYNGNGFTGMRLYIDSVSVGSTTEVGSYTGMTNTSQSVRFGKIPVITNFSLDGSMKDIRFFNGVKTQSQIQEIGNL